MGDVIHIGRPAVSGRLIGRHAKLVAVRAGLQCPSGQRFELKLPQRGDDIPFLPVAEIALADTESGGGGHLGSEVLDDVGVRHGRHYGAPHRSQPINCFNGRGTIGRMETIGSRIRAARKALGLNQTELAKAIGIDQSTVSDIENGALFGADVLMSLAQALLKSPQFIMTGEASPFDLSDTEAKMISAFRQAMPKEAPPATAPTPAKTGPRVRKISSPSSVRPQQRKAG